MPAWATWMALHLAAAAAGTWLARRYALSRSLLDQPGARRSHTVATPRAGGIAVAVTVLAGAAWLAWRTPEAFPALAGFMGGLSLVAAIGWIDDHRPLSPLFRLAVQAAAGLVLGWGLYVGTGDWRLLPLALVATLALVNVWNFMDGIDGLAASQAAVAAAAFAMVLGGPAVWLAWGLLAAVLGFLPFNFPRARIFLGDVGSGTLGFALAALGCLAFAQGAVAWPLLLLPLSAFLLDAGFTLGGRILRGEPWWLPHAQHLYQRLARRDRRHWRVTSAYLIFSMAAVTCLAWAAESSFDRAVLLCIAWHLSASVLWWILRKGVRDVTSSEAE